MHPSPVPHADVVTTTTHKTLRGPRGGMILAKANARTGQEAAARIVFPGIQGGPLMHVIAAKAVAFKEALEPDFKAYQQQVVTNAQALAEDADGARLQVVSGGTDNHLMLVDLTSQDITGKDAEAALGTRRHHGQQEHRAQRPAVAVRDLRPAHRHPGRDHARLHEADVRGAGGWICDVLDAHQDESVIDAVREKVTAQCKRFPVYG